MDQLSSTYRLCPDVLIKRWGNEAVVFHSASSDLYHLDEFSTCILARLDKQTLSHAQLIDAIQSHYQVDNLDQLKQQLTDKLNNFIRSDLVEIETI